MERQDRQGTVPDPPWELRYVDGNGNRLLIRATGAGSAVALEYSPVSPAHSSSGLYSGGEPAAARVGKERVEELWRRVRRLESDPTIRAGERRKGTGTFRLVEAGEARTFGVARGARLGRFDEWVADLVGGRARGSA